MRCGRACRRSAAGAAAAGASVRRQAAAPAKSKKSKRQPGPARATRRQAEPGWLPARCQPLFQPIADLGDAGLGAGFVLVAARCARDGNAADRVLASLDRDAAPSGGELRVELAGIEG